MRQLILFLPWLKPSCEFTNYEWRITIFVLEIKIAIVIEIVIAIVIEIVIEIDITIVIAFRIVIFAHTKP